MAVDRAHGHAGGGGDLVHADVGSVPGDLHPRGVEDAGSIADGVGPRRPSPGLRHGCLFTIDYEDERWFMIS